MTPSPPCGLTMNGGSSSIRLAVHEVGEALRCGLSARLVGSPACLLPIRACIRAGPGFPGIELDETQNRANASMLSTRSGRVNVRLIRINEELMIARSVCRVMGLATKSGGQHA